MSRKFGGQTKLFSNIHSHNSDEVNTK